MLLEQWVNSIFDNITKFIDDFRERHGLAAATLIITLVLVGLAMIYVRPNFSFFPENLIGSVDEYKRISDSPFNYPWSETPRGYRIAVPLLSWILGLRGESMIFTVIGLMLIFIFSLFYRYSRNENSTLIALSITTVFVFSSPVLYSIFDLANIDGIRIFLSVFMVWAAPYRILFWALFTANIFTHEGAAVFMPFFLLLRWPHRRNISEFVLFDAGIGLALVIGYLPFYEQSGNDEYLQPWRTGANEFFTATMENLKRWAWFGYDGIFAAFKLYWMLVFVAVIVAVKDRRWFDSLLVLSPFIGSAAILVVSWEPTRHVMIAAPALLIAFDQLCLRYGKETVARSVLYLGVINLFVPQQTSWGTSLGNLPSLPHTLLFWLL